MFLTGRIKDIVVLANGEKMPPGDIEEAILGDSLFEQVMVVGEGKAYLSALVVLNAERWQALAQEANIDAGALASPEAEKLVLERIGERMRTFPGYAQIRRAALVGRTVERGERPAHADAQGQACTGPRAQRRSRLSRLYEGH